METILQIGVFGLIFALHQYMISYVFLTLRLNKEEMTKVKDPHTIRIFDQYIFPIVFVIAIAIIAIIATLLVVVNQLWGALSYHALFFVDLVILISLPKEILLKSKVESTISEIPTIEYPNPVLNIVFQPTWLIALSLLVVIGSALAKSL